MGREGDSFSIYGPDYVTNMAFMPVYGKNFVFRTRITIVLKLGMEHFAFVEDGFYHLCGHDRHLGHVTPSINNISSPDLWIRHL